MWQFSLKGFSKSWQLKMSMRGRWSILFSPFPITGTERRRWACSFQSLFSAFCESSSSLFHGYKCVVNVIDWLTCIYNSAWGNIKYILTKAIWTESEWACIIPLTFQVLILYPRNYLNTPIWFNLASFWQVNPYPD